MDYTALTDSELAVELDKINREFTARQDRAALPGQIDEYNRRLLAAEGIEPWDAWRQPTSSHDSYPLGWQVEHGGTYWVATTSGTFSEPGVGSGWAQTDLPDSTPEWRAPEGLAQAYTIGDLVKFDGMKYRSLLEDNAWRPVGNPDAWDPVQEEAPVEPGA